MPTITEIKEEVNMKGMKLLFTPFFPFSFYFTFLFIPMSLLRATVEIIRL